MLDEKAVADEAAILAKLHFGPGDLIHVRPRTRLTMAEIHNLKKILEHAGIPKGTPMIVGGRDGLELDSLGAAKQRRLYEWLREKFG